MALNLFIFTMTSDSKLLQFSNKCISEPSPWKSARSLHAEQRTPGLSILPQGSKFKRLSFCLQNFFLPRFYGKKVLTSAFPEIQALLGWCMGHSLSVNRDRRQCFGKALQLLRVFAFTKELWLCVGTCELVLLKKEAAYNWVTDHNTLKNCGTLG